MEDEILHGAVFTMDHGEKIHLDRAEGLGRGYEIKDVTVAVNGSQPVQAFTYFATRIAENIRPFHWYREHVLVGAREHNFPDHYIDMIASVRVIEDANLQRTAKELSIHRSKP